MGVYYGAFNLTKREWFNGHDLDQGAKWWEAVHGAPAIALWTLLAPISREDAWRGRWVGDHVLIDNDAGITWQERIEALETEQPPERECGEWINIGRDLHQYLLDEHEIPCAADPDQREAFEDYEGHAFCKRCSWPQAHHGKLTGVSLRGVR